MENKLSIFIDGMIIYLENPKESMIKLIQTIKARYKINMKKLIACPYVNNI